MTNPPVEPESLQQLENKVWFTYSARIQTHKRLVFNNFWSNLILVIYSLATLIASIVSLKDTKFYGCYTSELIVVISAITLVASLIIVNVNYQTRILRMRDNYISLQKLYEKIKIYRNSCQESSVDLGKYRGFVEKYMSILEKNENHITLDDIANRCQAKKLVDRKPDYLEKWLWRLYKFGKYLLILMSLLLPGYLIISPLYKFIWY
ncbi:SLATT domain-containing protein [Neisseria subflava]|uniref:SLATT domain-containing protein n=1 Tax=Neisseria subflava TaxID=28449 RepID=UPI00280B70AE|nr:SLATT domain-containing protein [Neisseria subflava]